MEYLILGIIGASLAIYALVDISNMRSWPEPVDSGIMSNQALSAWYFGYLKSIRSSRRKANLGKRATWVFVVLLLPVVGPFAYFLFKKGQAS